MSRRLQLLDARRNDPRPLVLLRRLLSSLDGRSLLDAISVLAHVTDHPDILWSPRNWISPPVEEAVRKVFSWHPDELADIVRKTEAMGAVWQRGGHGQSLWMLLAADKKLGAKLPLAIHRAMEDGHIESATRLLNCYQAAARHLPDDIEAIVAQHPAILDNEFAIGIVETVRTEGRLPLF